MLKGVQELADAVSVTLGPKGRNVVIAKGFGDPHITKDGVTVAKAIEFSDHYKQVGASLIQDVAKRANTEAGDGTTTATIIARGIYEEGVKKVIGGVNPMQMWKGINKAIDVVMKELDAMKEDVSSIDQIRQVATVSANNDVKVGDLIARAIEAVGKEGFINVENGDNVNGMGRLFTDF